VRDRFGIAPLYWTRQGDWLLFASEIKGRLRLLEICFSPRRAGDGPGVGRCREVRGSDSDYNDDVERSTVTNCRADQTALDGIGMPTALRAPIQRPNTKAGVFTGF